MFRALFVILITFAYILVLGPPVVIYAMVTGNSDPLYRVGMRGARMAMWLAGVQLEVMGKEKIPQECAAVFLANHQGNCDPPALLPILPPVRVMVKKEFFRVPILGRGMLLRGFIPVDRRNRDRAIAAVEEAVRALKAGHSFMAFPEGTRSRDGRLQPFKKGVFVMAIKAGAPVVPISVSGSGKIMPKGKFAIRPGCVRITIHEAIPTAGCSTADRQILMDRVRQSILTGLEREEWPWAEASRLPTASSTADAATSSQGGPDE
jgi:1-acyl-sn-glycerol-3-phosphate acyltransferase